MQSSKHLHLECYDVFRLSFHRWVWIICHFVFFSSLKRLFRWCTSASESHGACEMTVNETSLISNLRFAQRKMADNSRLCCRFFWINWSPTLYPALVSVIYLYIIHSNIILFVKKHWVNKSFFILCFSFCMERLTFTLFQFLLLIWQLELCHLLLWLILSLFINHFSLTCLLSE